MINAMKKFKLLALLCLLGLFFASCKEESKSEWKSYYGYTKDDIIGTYSFSNVKGAFDGVEGVGRHSCLDAEIRINDYGGNSVEFKINCPSEDFSYTFTGRPTPLANDFMLKMSSGYSLAGNGKLKAFNVMAHVLENDAQQMRLHGYASKNTYKLVPFEGTDLCDTVPEDGEYYYFDVIKN